MNRKLAEERETMVSLERWEILWTAGAKGGVCRLELVLDLGVTRSQDRKYVWLERRSGRRLPTKFIRYVIWRTIRKRIPIPEEEPIECTRRKDGYRIQLRNNGDRSIMVDRNDGIRDFIVPADELSKLLLWFPLHEPKHINGEDIEVFAI